MSSEHTPGPWTVGPEEQSSHSRSHLVYIPIFGHGRCISSTGVYGRRGGTSTGRRDVPEPECRANARLIAAAPELLEACKSALPNLRWANLHGSRCEELIALVEAAIAKATGEEK